MTDLASRSGLPDALRILLAQYPRTGWDAHPHADGLVRFWLHRHLAFRDLLAALASDARAVIDVRLDPGAYARRLFRLGGHLVGDLHGHHRIEDGHYFPLLARIEPRLARGSGLLDADHHALAGHLDRFARAADAVLRDWRGAGLRDRAADLLAVLSDGERLLGRHLTDEEDLIVPIILAHGPDRLG